MDPERDGDSTDGEGVHPAGSSEEYLAHVARGDDGSWRVHRLEDHLRATGALAAEFAAVFGSGDWAELAGRWHDLGKHRDSFQRYLRAASGWQPDAHLETLGRVDHSTAGAVHARERLGDRGRIIAYLVAGHHAGLPDWRPLQDGTGALSLRLEQRDLLADALRAPIPDDITRAPVPTSRPPVPTEEAMHLWVRMLFSCLVDADFLDTERFMDEGRASSRERWPTLSEVRDRLTMHLQSIGDERPISQLRTAIREECLSKAGSSPGFFSLTVPTGGGKTLSSLAFALDHAARHGLRRVIYAIPYVSIIEQTADVFRGALGDAVLEHHANLDPDEVDTRSRLAAENWDAPVVVTTVVQLFESLFAARPARCRKLHNLARSVIVLDEAQLLPPPYLDPILAALRQLTAGFGVTVVLSTATQPALGSRTGFGRSFRGLDDVRELVDDPEGLWPRFDRVEVSWPDDPNVTRNWEEVAEAVAAERQVLCVVNSRADCRHLVALLPRDTVHLSALMCAEHRASVIDRVRRDLHDGHAIRVVSTQLIEAGVDVDFPVVFRALAGLDSIAQSAGRCNREAGLDRGRVVVFVPPRPSPAGHLRKAEQATRALLATRERSELLTPSGFRRYFELLYGSFDTLDEREILPLLIDDARSFEFQFRTAAARFRLIDDVGSAVVLVPYGRGSTLLRELEQVGPERWVLRRLQRFTVSVHELQLHALRDAGVVREVQPGLFVLDDPARYDERLGLLLDEPVLALSDLVA